MSDLDDEDRSLFDTARAGYEPREEDRKRVLSGVLLRAGVVAGMTSAVNAGAAATGGAAAPVAGAVAASSLVGLVFKITIWMAIGASLGVGGYAVSRSGSSGARAVPSNAQARTAASTSKRDGSEQYPTAPGQLPTTRPVEAPPPAPLSSLAGQEQPAGSSPDGAQAVSPPVERGPSPAGAGFAPASGHDGAAALAVGTPAPAVAVFPSEASAASPSASAPTLALSVEARALAKVERALKEGLGAQALRLVEDQRQQFARGALQPERDAARIVALCAVGRVSDARAAARDFLATSPRSPLAARIRASCAGQ